MTRNWLVAIVGGLAVAVLALAWITFAPTSLGGRTNYLLTAGTSMEPGISQGDLVLLREQSSYDVGDIVAYEFDDRIILHRVIDINGQRFIMQGDNNPTPDPHQPGKDEIQGRLWLQVPAPSTWDVSPGRFWVIISLIFIGGLTVVMIPASSRATTAAREIAASFEGRGAAGLGSERFTPLLGTAGQLLSFVIAMLGLASLLLAAIAFSRPIEETAISEAPFTQRATFAYSADAPGSIYDGGALQTGDPIYQGLVDEVAFTFGYLMDPSFPSDVSGTYRLDAVIRNADGWSSEIPLLGPTPFTGPQFEAAGTLDLDDVRARIAVFEEAMDVAGTEYTLSIVPAVTVENLGGERPQEDGFTPRLNFLIDGSVLRLAEPGDERRGEAIQRTQTGTALQRESVANTIPLLVGDIEVGDARRLSIIGLTLAVICGLVVILMVRAAMQAPEPDQIAARYGARVVDLRGANIKANGRLVEVSGFEDLLKVAGQGERHVLHFQKDGRHFYFVQTADLTYGYRTSSAPRRASSTDAPLTGQATRSLPPHE